MAPPVPGGLSVGAGRDTTTGPSFKSSAVGESSGKDEVALGLGALGLGRADSGPATGRIAGIRGAVGFARMGSYGKAESGNTVGVFPIQSPALATANPVRSTEDPNR